MDAKKSEMRQAGITNISDNAVKKAIKREELAKHCRRGTRGVETTIKMVEELLLGLSSATDTLGVPLLREEMPDEQKHHVHCLQDPPNVLLYTITGHLRKGSVIYRSARGSTSLESFHMHLARFIPGSSANEVNFQAYPYLLDGITRWNYQRYCSSFESLQGDQLRTFNMSLQQARAHSLSLSIYGASVISSYKPPSTYTCSLSQDRASTLDINASIDEGFEDFVDQPLVEPVGAPLTPEEDLETVALAATDTREPSEESSDSVEEQSDVRASFNTL